MNPVSAAEIRIDSTRRQTNRPLAELWRARDLAFLLARREVQLRYQHSFAGIGWAVMQPLLTVIVLTIFQAFVARPSSGKVPYPLYAMTGLVPWTFFVHTLTQCSNSILRATSIVRKVHFPRLVLPLSSVMAASVDFLVALPLIPILMLFYGIAPHRSLLLMPLILLHLVLLAAGIGIWLAVLNTRFRDTANALPFVTQLWFFLTPIAYPASAIPGKWQMLAGLNPMLGLLEGFRWALFGDARPMLLSWIGVSLALTLVLFVSGVLVFFADEADFAELI